MTAENTRPSPSEILRYYRSSLLALERFRVALEKNEIAPESHFLGMPSEDVFGLLLTELKAQVVLALVASYEAVLQVDLQDRVRRRPKDAASRRLCSIEMERRRKERSGRSSGRIPIERIVNAWAAELDHPRTFQKFRELVKLRNWLAHGRYWTQQSGIQRIDPLEAWQRGAALFRLLPGLEPLEPV